MLAELAQLVDDATRAFEDFDYARSLQRTEDFFWRFCDDYLELVKARAYRDDDPAAVSARVALRTAVSTLLRLFAPIVPYVTEEVWSWCQAPDGPLPGFTSDSIHRAAWPTSGELRAMAADGSSADGIPSPLVVAADVLSRIRKAKSDAKVSQRAEVALVTVTDTSDRLIALAAAEGDVKAAGSVTELATAELDGTGEGTVDVVLAPVAEAEPA